MRLSTLILAMVLGFGSHALAQSPARGFRYGVDLGVAALHGDLNSQGMRFAAGFTAAHQFDDTMSIDLHYVGSSFDDIDHRTVDVGGSYYLPGEGYETHLSSGFSFINNDFKLLSRAGNSVALYVGGGASWLITDSLRAGIDFRFRKASTAKATIGASTSEITTVGDSSTVLLVLTHHPDFSE